MFVTAGAPMTSHPCVWQKINQGRESRSLYFPRDAGAEVSQGGPVVLRGVEVVVGRAGQGTLKHPQKPESCEGVLGYSSDGHYRRTVSQPS